jgi:hypothetical protein
MNDDDDVVENENDATSVCIGISGVYLMRPNDTPLDFKRIIIKAEYNANFKKKFFYITLIQAKGLYYGALYPTPEFIERIFDGKRRMLVSDFESNMKIDLSSIINTFQTDNCVFIIDGCRFFSGHPQDLIKRRVSSGSAEEIIVAPILKRSSGKKGDSLMGLGIKTRKMKRKRIKRRR